MATAPALTSFNAGELSGLLDARVDFAKYAGGTKLLQNFIPTVQGPARQRPGSRFVSEVKNSANRSWLAKFEFNPTNAYGLEFGNQYLRFYTQRARLVNAGVPVEVATPYVQAALFNADLTPRLRTAQSGDFLYITHSDYQQRILKRTSQTAFELDIYEAKGGPFKDLNDTDTTVYASAQTGNITITASTAIFQAGHVGSLFSIEAKSLNSVPAWEVSKAITAGALRRVGLRVYQALNSATTGSATPVHTEGALFDGDTGVQWQFQDSGYGWARITGYVSPTVVNATVVSPIPANATGAANATKRWAHAAWSTVEGWPTDVAFFRERLVFMRKQKGWMSVASAFDDFSSRDDSGQVTADMAISFELSSGQINDVQWLLPDKDLLAGTASGEFSIGELTNGSAIGPGNIRVQLQSQFGSRAIVPAQAGSAILFVQRAGRKMREISYDFTSDGYRSNDRTSLSEHITSGGVIDLDYAQEPDSVVWATKASGDLVGFTWNAEQNVWAWHRHQLSGQVESVMCMPSPDQSVNDVWLIVNRTINGVTRRYVEWIEEHWEGGTDDQDGDAPTDKFYVDCGATYRGAATKTVTGLGYLEGQEVSILADGSPHPFRVVTGGAVTLQSAASVVQVGLPMVARIQTMRLEAGAQNGTAQGKTKRINKITFRFKDTSSGRFGPSFEQMDEFTFRQPNDPMNQPVPAFTGDKLVSFPAGYGTDGFICFENIKPLPVTMLGMFPIISTSDAR
jgi:hypothetical protein